MENAKEFFTWIPCLFFGSLFCIAGKKAKVVYVFSGRAKDIKNYLPMLIVGIYLLASVSTLLVVPDLWYPYFDSRSYKIINVLLYSIFLTIFLLPALKIKPLLSTQEIPNTNILNNVMILMAFLAWYSVIYQIPYAIKSTLLGAKAVRLGLAYEDYRVMPKSFATTIAVGISYFNIFYMALFFIALKNKKSRFLIFSMLVGSLSYVVSGLSFTSRDCIVFFILNFIFTYCFFINAVALNILYSIKKFFTIIIFILLIFLAVFTAQRFNDRDVSALSYGVIGYIGQQPFVFSETLEKQKEYYGGNLRFPVFKSILADKQEVVRTTHYEWMFGTFIKDFYSEGGFTFLIISALTFVPFFWYKLKKKESNFCRKLIVIFFYYQFISQGVFYFKMGERAGNLYLLILLSIYFFTYIHDFMHNRINGNVARFKV